MKKLFKFIGLIFKGIWKSITFIRLALANLIFLLMIAVFYFAFTYTGEGRPVIEKESALVMNLSGPIVEQRRYVNPMDSVAGSLLGNEMPKENVLFDIVDTIRYAKDDAKVSGLVLALRDLPETNLTKLRYIAKALNEFKASGKPVYAVGDFYNQSQYYLASYADKVYMAPDGGVLIKGYSAYSMYYKTLLEKLDVSTHVFRVGTYKSAIEPFIRDDMSDAAKESATRWVTQLWSAFVDDVTTNRNINAKVLNPTMEELLAEMKSVDGDLAQLAVKMGLVDELATRQDIRTLFAKEFGSDGKDSYNAISYYDYLATIRPDYTLANHDIAVVVASGAIMDGQQPRGTVGGDTVASLLRQARNDEKVKAVVLRVDSPGGSAFASEVIRNEVEALKKAGKPVVVSMSSLAASGGYWISMSADKIVAQPTTLTGSIGIFSVITTFEKGFSKLGINTDGVGTSPFSGDGITTGLSEGASQAFQLGIEHGYKRFISLVGSNRDMTVEEVDKVAQGRVWTGQDALSFGLVDQMGDFDDAVELAAKLANVTDYGIYWVEEPLSPTELFLQEFMNQVKVSLGVDATSLLPKSLQPVAQQFEQDASLLQSFNDPKGQYAFCLNCQVQ
ncbi:signal peptide peptidase SppA [Vibrio parahaemolyticus]|uniref:Signal peptide peptidase SppA n=5 Tax=Vibrio parahaemolyticus TaxID=670 RepID=A0A7Z2MT34_VIBPH|nr:signal peptide peptidase SppA [Vibrio parahaemolyticus]EFO38507.1 signal peptide peptidase SppA, 67K type [Vibrio parahaemolyticus Peru-466]EFO47283.1 signal peptide peptidase SppA, 67K type [Vibrio parahaemolyticus AQ4037]EFO52626.1 signal peptide peptidase SppA, 67K type [Vibrio parahaemolyticus K5030]EJG0872865.1 signal peptide peptidase SppA [Vibrio parahaemolyticus O3]EJG0901523.1 signal peptide peptidase SppA [Vibrio parahaemolyticus O3:K56]EJG1076274.1 signal peptide peptidase SppA 